MGDEVEVRSRAPGCAADGQRGGAWPARRGCWLVGIEQRRHVLGLEEEHDMEELRGSGEEWIEGLGLVRC